MTEDAEMGREGMGVSMVLPGQHHETGRQRLIMPLKTFRSPLEKSKEATEAHEVGASEEKLAGSFIHLLLSPRLTGLPAAKPVPISKRKVWMRMAPRSAHV